jgi:hypothetical protein
MSILLSGDFHANAMNEIDAISAGTLRDQFKDEYPGIKYHIIAGDCGFLWPGNEKQDRFNLSLLNRRPWPILCLFGNHDNYEAISACEKVDIGIGQKVHRVFENVYFLPRGFIYNIDGLQILCLGGALSIDKAYRLEHVSWWKDEYWTAAEERGCLERTRGKNVDYIISHTGPQELFGEMFGNRINAQKHLDRVARFNNLLRDSVHFGHWLFGHFHLDVLRHKYKDQFFSGLYRKTAVISKNLIKYSDGSSWTPWA